MGGIYQRRIRGVQRAGVRMLSTLGPAPGGTNCTRTLPEAGPWILFIEEGRVSLSSSGSARLDTLSLSSHTLLVS